MVRGTLWRAALIRGCRGGGAMPFLVLAGFLFAFLRLLFCLLPLLLGQLSVLLSRVGVAERKNRWCTVETEHAQTRSRHQGEHLISTCGQRRLVVCIMHKEPLSHADAEPHSMHAHACKKSHRACKQTYMLMLICQAFACTRTSSPYSDTCLSRFPITELS